MHFFKGHFSSTVKENQYAKYKIYLKKIKRCTHAGLILLLLYMHKHAENYYRRKENGKQYSVTHKQCFFLLLLESFFFFFLQGYDVILYKKVH